MENKIDFFKRIFSYLVNPNQDSLNMSLNNVHAEGLFSLVINGTEPGKLTRVFIADKKLKPFGVQLHTHRYPIKITGVLGKITHHVAVITHKENFPSVSLSQYSYRSFLNGGNGLSYVRENTVICSDNLLPIGGSVNMTVNDFHTVSCSKGSIWIVEEGGFEIDYSQVLGVPFIVDHLYSKPELFQVNDKCQLVKKHLSNIINSYTN